MKKAAKIWIWGITVFLVLSLSVFFGTGAFFLNLVFNSDFDVYEKFKTSSGEPYLVNDEWFNSGLYEDVYIENSDSQKLHAYEFDNNYDVWVVILHGYRSSGKRMSNFAFNFYRLGYNVLVTELRGCGQSEGGWIGMGYYEQQDLLEWLNYINNKNPNHKIILFGVSMGAATVMLTAGNEALPNNVICAIEDCGYTSVEDQFEHLTRYYGKISSKPVLYSTNILTKAFAGFSIYDIKPIDALKNCKIPIMFIHGTKDRYVPYSMLERLYEAAKCEKEILSIENAGHVRSASVEPLLYWSKISDFCYKHTIAYNAIFSF